MNIQLLSKTRYLNIYWCLSVLIVQSGQRTEIQLCVQEELLLKRVFTYAIDHLRIWQILV